MRRLAVAAMISVIAVPAYAAPGDTSTATGDATARVVLPLTIVHNIGSTLHFGTLTAGTGGTVQVAVDGAGRPTGNVTLLPSDNTRADRFFVTGEPNRSFDVLTFDGTVDDGGNSMSFTTLASTGASGTLDSLGNLTIDVGGELTVLDRQPAGFYTGTYDVTVTYN